MKRKQFLANASLLVGGIILSPSIIFAKHPQTIARIEAKDSILLWNLLAGFAASILAGAAAQVLYEYVKKLTCENYPDNPIFECPEKLIAREIQNRNSIILSENLNPNHAPFLATINDRGQAISAPEDYMFHPVTIADSNTIERAPIYNYRNGSQCHVVDLRGARFLGVTKISEQFSNDFDPSTCQNAFAPMKVLSETNSNNFAESFSQPAIYATNYGKITINYAVIGSGEGSVSIAVKAPKIDWQKSIEIYFN